MEIPKNIEQKEIPQKFDRIYVLAHGEPDQPLSMDSKIRILAAMELAKNNSEAEIYFVGGGRPGEGEPTAKQMSDYFERTNRSAKNQISNKTHILDKSNNTVANIEEILESMICEPYDKQKSVAILSNEYHMGRIKEILHNFDLETQALPTEDLLQNRSKHHKKFVEKYEGSFGYKKKEVIDKMMCLYLKLDPEQNVVKKFREWRRKK